MLSVTPLALLMGQTVQRVPVGPLLWDRGVETVIGSVVGVGLLMGAHWLRSRGGRAVQQV
jgi:hypothetical protein